MSDIQVTDQHSWFDNMLHEVQELRARGHVFLTKEELAAKDSIVSVAPPFSPPEDEKPKGEVVPYVEQDHIPETGIATNSVRAYPAEPETSVEPAAVPVAAPEPDPYGAIVPPAKV